MSHTDVRRTSKSKTDLIKFQDLVASVQRLTPSTIEFDLVGVDASIANALRRTLIAEVSLYKAFDDISMGECTF